VGRADVAHGELADRGEHVLFKVDALGARHDDATHLALLEPRLRVVLHALGRAYLSRGVMRVATGQDQRIEAGELAACE
jgi:hypothetical protein